MVASAGVGYDAARLTLVTMETIGRADPKACRKFRRRLIAAMRLCPALPDVKAEAVRGIERGCGRCGDCKGV